MGNPKSGSTVIATGYDFEYRSCSNTFELRKANDCDLIFLSPQPKGEALGIIYPARYLPFQFSRMRGPARIGRDFLQGRKAKALVELAGADGKILDVGTGSGILIRQLARVRGSRENLYANDFSEEVLAPLHREGFQTVVGQAEQLDLAERFQAISLNQVLEHLQNPVKVVDRLRQLLAPGGYLFIETPSTDGLDAQFFRKRYWGGYHIPRHFWLFNESSLRELLAGAGLRVISVSYMCSPVFWIQSFHHFLLDHGWLRLAQLFSEKNPLLLAVFTLVDSVMLALGRRTSNIRMVAQRTV